MRDYAKLAPTFWTGATGKALRRRGPEAVIVAVYLMSAPGSNMLGLYYQPILYMAHETGLGIEGASKGLQACIEEGFCRFDEASEMVWVVEMARYQIADELKAADKRCAGIQKDYEGLPDNPFLGDFFERYQRAFQLTRSRGKAGGIEAPSKPHRSQEQEQEQEQEEYTTPGGVVCPRPSADDQPSLAGLDIEASIDPQPQPGRKPTYSPPDCPHSAILDAWAEELPAMLQHNRAEWPGTRADNLRSRWRAKAAEKRWPDVATGVEFMRRLFRYVGKSAFLTGRTEPAPGRRQFAITLEWLVKAGNWSKVIEGQFHDEGEAHQ